MTELKIQGTIQTQCDNCKHFTLCYCVEWPELHKVYKLCSECLNKYQETI